MKIRRFDYFEAFVGFTQKACFAAELLNRTFLEFDPDNTKILDDMHEVEHEADKIRHDVTERLSKEFMAPIEREDIIALAIEFDNVVDSIEETIRKIYMYNIRSLRDDVLDFSQLLVKVCEALYTLTVEFADFRKTKNIRDLIINVHTIESEADSLHFDAMSKLFKSNTDIKDMLCWRSVYDTLEVCFDNCEHASEIIESVILKNT